MKTPVEQQLAELRAGQRVTRGLVGGFVVAVLALVVVGAPIALAGGYDTGGYKSGGEAVTGVAIAPSSIASTGVVSGTTHQATANNAYGFCPASTSIGIFYGFSHNLTDPGNDCNTTASPDGFSSSLAYDGDGHFHVSCERGAAARLSGVVASNTTAVGNLGASGPDDLQTYTLPASVLVHTGRCLRVTATGTTTNNANAKTVRLVFGAGPTAMITKQLTASIAGTWQLEGVICRTGASAQRYWGTGENSGGTTVSTTDGAGVWRVPTVTSTATETETGTIVIKTQSTTSTTDNDIVSQVLQVEVL